MRTFLSGLFARLGPPVEGGPGDDNPEGYGSPAKYISSVESLAEAAKDKDHTAARAAMAGLSKSCVSCHFYNVPGN